MLCSFSSLKMSSLCMPCKYDGVSYRFTTVPVNFNEAKKKCKEYNGTLAEGLDEGAYLKFNDCCASTAPQQYYIGLFKDQTKCTRGKTQFRWSESNTCTDGSPLSNLMKQTNRGCRAVLISVPAQDPKQLPGAMAIDCSAAQRYVCQLESDSYESPKSSLTTNTPNTKFSPSVVYDAGVNPVLIAGLVTGFLILILLLALVFLCAYLYKNGQLRIIPFGKKNKKHSASKKEKADLNQVKINPLYDGFSFSSAEDKASFSSRPACVQPHVTFGNAVNACETVHDSNEYHTIMDIYELKPNPSHIYELESSAENPNHLLR